MNTWCKNAFKSKEMRKRNHFVHSIKMSGGRKMLVKLEYPQHFGKAYRVTIPLVKNLQLTSRQKFRFGLHSPVHLRLQLPWHLKVAPEQAGPTHQWVRVLTKLEAPIDCKVHLKIVKKMGKSAAISRSGEVVSFGRAAWSQAASTLTTVCPQLWEMQRRLRRGGRLSHGHLGLHHPHVGHRAAAPFLSAAGES